MGSGGHGGKACSAGQMNRTGRCRSRATAGWAGAVQVTRLNVHLDKGWCSYVPRCNDPELKGLAVTPAPAAAMLLPPPRRHQRHRHWDSAQARPLLPQRCRHAIRGLHSVSCCCGGLQGNGERKISLCACAHKRGMLAGAATATAAAVTAAGHSGALAGCTSLLSTNQAICRKTACTAGTVRLVQPPCCLPAWHEGPAADLQAAACAGRQNGTCSQAKRQQWLAVTLVGVRRRKQSCSKIYSIFPTDTPAPICRQCRPASAPVHVAL